MNVGVESGGAAGEDRGGPGSLESESELKRFVSAGSQARDWKKGRRN